MPGFYAEIPGIDPWQDFPAFNKKIKSKNETLMIAHNGGFKNINNERNIKIRDFFFQCLNLRYKTILMKL